MAPEHEERNTAEQESFSDGPRNLSAPTAVITPVGSRVGEEEGEPAEDDHDRDREETRDREEKLPLAFLSGSINVRSIALTGLFVFALLYTLFFARTFLMPIVLALLLKFLFEPVVKALKRFLLLPHGVGAALVLIVLLGGLGYGGYRLSGPATTWLQKLPEGIRKLEPQLRRLQRQMAGLMAVTEQVEELTDGEKDVPEVAVAREERGFASLLLNTTQEFVAGAVVMFVLLYFLLASGDHFLRKLVRVFPKLEDKKRVVDVVRQVQSDISIYLLTIAAINVGLGAAVAGAMYLLGVPNPLLWGIVATLLNFLPYIGAIAGVVIMFLVAVMSFDRPSDILLPPFVYYALTFLEGSFVTPYLLGFRLTLSPVAILLSLIFWLWIWGIPGALLAVPILATLKIACDRVEPLHPLGELLGR